MSKDNTVVVLKTKGKTKNFEFRVKEIQAAENIVVHAEGGATKMDTEVVLQLFSDCKVQTRLEDAMVLAAAILEDAGNVEYGIQIYNFEEEGFPN